MPFPRPPGLRIEKLQFIEVLSSLSDGHSSCDGNHTFEYTCEKGGKEVEGGW